MAITQISVQSPTGETIFTDTAIGATIDGVKSSSAVVYYITVNNSANGSAVYLKLFNLASGSVTVGTTVPDQVLYCPSSVISTFTLFTGAAPGITFSSALSACCVTTGGTAGTTPPSSSVIASISYV